MASKKQTSPKILMVMNGPPWSPWTMSGVSKGVCTALLNRGALYGAISHRCPTSRNLVPTPWRRLESLFFGLVTRFLGHSSPSWQSESSPGLAAILTRIPASTAVVYTYVNPEYQETYDLQRYRWIGISVLDAAEYQAYGHRGLDKSALREKYQAQYKTIHQSEAIFTHSSYGADSIARDYNYPREKIFPIGAGASLQFGSIKRSRPDRFRRCNILFIGRDWERKGGPLVYAAFKLLRAEIPHATLTIVGPTEQPVFGPGVLFAGFLRKHRYRERRKLKKLYLNASIFCTPSVCETWGLVYVEAAAAGLPIVGTYEWAMPDIVLNGKTGVLCNERSPEAIAKAMASILVDPIGALKMGQEAAKYVRDVLDWPHVADRIIAAISPELLKGRKPIWLPRDIVRSKKRPQ